MQPHPAGGKESIGDCILEVHEDRVQFELDHSGSGFLALALVGSVKARRALATTGGHGKTIPCVCCHGFDLRGSDIASPLAGRSPGNLVRQPYNFWRDKLLGDKPKMMKPVVENLSQKDIDALAA